MRRLLVVLVALASLLLTAPAEAKQRWEHHDCKQPVRVSEFRTLLTEAHPSPFVPPTRTEHRRLLASRLCALNKDQAKTMKRDHKEARRPLRKVKRAVASTYAVMGPIASCESGGDPTAISANGTYRGKYQFDYGTWGSVGGSGDPAAAPELEQDYRAHFLYRQRGTQPWPTCGSGR